MVFLKSERSNSILNSPVAYVPRPTPQMRKYPGTAIDLWVGIEAEGVIVKNLSFSGNLPEHLQVLLESTAVMLKKKNLSSVEALSLREAEAFLRDKNSVPALEGLEQSDELSFKNILSWIRTFPLGRPPEAYDFPSEKGPFRNLKLADKVRELKAFLNSTEIRELYRDRPRPELVDVEDLLVYVQVPYASEEDRAAFEELHVLGVSTFQEESLNFIPEA